MQYRGTGVQSISRFNLNFRNMTWLSERCNLAPLNKSTRAINTILVAQLPLRLLMVLGA